MTTLCGLINLDKPAGITSRDAINVVQRLVRPHKVGHAGTLDPLATGVLIVTIGQATRLTSLVQDWPKSYRAEFLLGRESNTEDITGNVTVLADSREPSWADLDTALPQFVGAILQQPPAFSALKVAGRRAYDLARAGHEVDLAPRPITIHALQIVHFEYPTLTLEVECSSGTYIRSLGRDLARAVGSGAVMSRLARTAIGHLKHVDAVRPNQLTHTNLVDYLLPPLAATSRLPSLPLDATQLAQLRHGIPLALTVDAPELAAVTPDGHLAAILSHVGDGRFRPRCNFVAGPASL